METAEQISIRRAKLTDVEELAQLELKAWIAQYVSTEYGVSEEEIKQLDTSARIRDWKHILQSINYRVWLAINKSAKPVGFVAARQTDDEAELYGLWLLPGHSREVAWQLGLVAIDWLSAKKRITTRVAVHDRATLATLAQLKFEVNEAGPVDFIVLKSGTKMPTVEMQRMSQKNNNLGRKQNANVGRAKQLVRRTELGKKSGVRPSTIKHYTEFGLLPFSQEGERLSRRYDLQNSLQRLSEINKLRLAGYSLERVKKELKS
jgi:hypothetical protein